MEDIDYIAKNLSRSLAEWLTTYALDNAPLTFQSEPNDWLDFYNMMMGN